MTASDEAKTPFARLRDFARKIVAVPKAEIDEKEAEYQRQRKARKAQISDKVTTR